MNKPRGRPFQIGNTFGRGRPKGSRNKEKFPGQHLFAQFSDGLIRNCIAQAGEGSATAMKVCMDRLNQLQRVGVGIRLPQIKTAKDVEVAAERTIQGIRHGKITPAEGEAMMRVLESRLRVMENVELEQRLKRLEESAGLKEAA